MVIATDFKYYSLFSGETWGRQEGCAAHVIEIRPVQWEKSVTNPSHWTD